MGATVLEPVAVLPSTPTRCIVVSLGLILPLRVRIRCNRITQLFDKEVLTRTILFYATVNKRVIEKPKTPPRHLVESGLHKLFLKHGLIEKTTTTIYEVVLYRKPYMEALSPRRLKRMILEKCYNTLIELETPKRISKIIKELWWIREVYYLSNRKIMKVNVKAVREREKETYKETVEKMILNKYRMLLIA